MNSSDRWLDHLPMDGRARQLLLAADRDRPEPNTADRGWQALTVSLGIASASAVASGSAAASIATGPSITSTISVALVAKSVAIGFTLGVGMIGSSAVATHLYEKNASPSGSAVAIVRLPAPSPRRVSVKRDDAEIEAPSIEPRDASIPNQGALIRQENTHQMAELSRVPSVNTTGSKKESLANQARELAEIKRLLDAGAALEAKNRLQTDVARRRLLSLAEDRDALLVEALVKTQRFVEARREAHYFFDRYPTSSYREKIRRMVETE
jgi:hypothetical protein